VHTDHLGTPQTMTDNSATVVWKGDYKPFGEVNEVVGSVDNNFCFPMQYYDAESGLYYNWNRYYLAGAGRYLTADPIGLDGGLNLYGYAEGDPVNYKDLFGLKNCCDGKKEIIYRNCDEWMCLSCLINPYLCVRSCLCCEIECGIVLGCYPCLHWAYRMPGGRA